MIICIASRNAPLSLLHSPSSPEKIGSGTPTKPPTQVHSKLTACGPVKRAAKPRNFFPTPLDPTKVPGLDHWVHVPSSSFALYSNSQGRLCPNVTSKPSMNLRGSPRTPQTSGPLRTPMMAGPLLVKSPYVEICAVRFIGQKQSSGDCGVSLSRSKSLLVAFAGEFVEPLSKRCRTTSPGAS